jgi:hypothetical protein
MDETTADDLERELAVVSAELTEPHEDECVLCYTSRMLAAFGCDTTLRWVRRWRDLRRPKVRGLERRMESRGGFCDCEVFWNGWTLREELLVVGEDDEEPEFPEIMPACAGVGPRSSQPCAHWVTWRRSGW